MPRLSVGDCEVLLRAIEERPTLSSGALRAARRLRERLEQAESRGAASERQRQRSRPPPELEVSATCTLHVCTSCRSPGTPREPKENRPGFALYHQLREVVEASSLRERVTVAPAECLSLCPRPCGIALSTPGAWTYLFGDQRPDETTRDVVECVSLYLRNPEGFMTREQRPKPLRGSILGRVPPPPGGRTCT